MTVWPKLYGGGVRISFCSAMRGVLPTFRVTVDGFDGTVMPPGSTAWAVAVFTICPASMSAWVTVYDPVQTTVDVSAGAGSMVVRGHDDARDPRIGDGEVGQRLQTAVGDDELIGDDAAQHERIGQVRPCRPAW